MSEGKIVLRRLKETLDVIKGKTIIGQVDFQIRNMVEDCIDVIETQKAEIEKKDKMIDKMLKQDQEKGHGSAYEMQNEDFEAIQGLLDLYQKEKEKNKELENADLTTVYMNGFYDGEKKWKDKIKRKAMEYENNNDGYDCTTADYKESQNIGKYLACIELLNERN